MPFRFRRSIRLAPGVRLNLSKSGVSTSVDKCGGWHPVVDRLAVAPQPASESPVFARPRRVYWEDASPRGMLPRFGEDACQRLLECF